MSQRRSAIVATNPALVARAVQISEQAALLGQGDTELRAAARAANGRANAAEHAVAEFRHELAQAHDELERARAEAVRREGVIRTQDARLADVGLGMGSIGAAAARSSPSRSGTQVSGDRCDRAGAVPPSRGGDDYAQLRRAHVRCRLAVIARVAVMDARVRARSDARVDDGIASAPPLRRELAEAAARHERERARLRSQLQAAESEAQSQSQLAAASTTEVAELRALTADLTAELERLADVEGTMQVRMLHATSPPP